MKRKFFIIMTLAALAVLALAVSPASAATRTINLLSAKLEFGKSAAVFQFRVHGEFDKFGGFVVSSGNQTRLNCNLQENGEILICRMAKGAPGLAGKVVQVVVNGFSFDTVIESVPVCYQVYDWPQDELVPLGPWVSYGEHCVEEEVQEGESIWFTSPEWGTWEYLFMNEGGFCGRDGSWNHYGNGYYYPYCVVFE